MAGGGGGAAGSGTWCQSTILPLRMRKTAVARWPGPSQALVGRSPRRKVAVTVAPRVESATILPEQGRPAGRRRGARRGPPPCPAPPGGPGGAPRGEGRRGAGGGGGGGRGERDF